MTRVLHLFGGWPGHSPYQVAAGTRDLLAELGAEVEESQDVYRLDADLTDFDLVVLGWTSILATESLTEGQERGLLTAVEQGTGLVAWHGAGASFRASLNYHFLLGGDFVAHPGGYPVEYGVRIVDPEHPVSREVSDFRIATEQYYLQVDPNVRVLAETEFDGEHLPWLRGHRSPVAWVRRWGAGRVFYHAIGHTPQDLLHPEVRRLTRQGLRWAVRS